MPDRPLTVGRREEKGVWAIIIECLPVCFSQLVHVDVQLSPPVEMGVRYVVVLVTGNVLEGPCDSRFSEEGANGGNQIVRRCFG